jgi:hypothetical protein
MTTIAIMIQMMLHTCKILYLLFSFCLYGESSSPYVKATEGDAATDSSVLPRGADGSVESLMDSFSSNGLSPDSVI